MTSKAYFLLFFISWQQFKATPHSCVLLCMMKNRWGTQIYKLLQPISISSVVARAGLGLEWRLFNVQTWSRGRWRWGTFLTLSRHLQTQRHIFALPKHHSQRITITIVKQKYAACFQLPRSSQHTLWPSLSLLMRLAFSTLGKILTNIFDTSY